MIGNLEPLLALNNAHATELSWLDRERLETLIARAFFSRCVVSQRGDDVDAFLLAFDQGADYNSPNFLWYRERYDRFVYVDRVVVAPAARGRGLARRLYEELFTHARSAGHERIVCEVNSDPPNPGSDAFHATLGFGTVGAATLPGGAKTVRYLMRSL